MIIFPLCWVMIQHSIRACISRRRHGSQGERSGSSRTGNHLQYVRMRTGCKRKPTEQPRTFPHPENTRIRTRVCLPTSTRKATRTMPHTTLDEVSTTKDMLFIEHNGCAQLSKAITPSKNALANGRMQTERTSQTRQ